MEKLLAAYFLLLTFSQCVLASKILFLTPVATKSHKNVFDPLIDGLALRNHEITVVSPVKSSKVPKSVREIVPLPLEQVMSSAMKDAFELRRQGTVGIFNAFNATSIGITCSQMYQNDQVQQMMKDEKMDLIFINGFVNQCTFALVSHFKAPFILITSMAAPSSIARKLGNEFPKSFVPESFFPFSNRMTFLERVLNFVGSLALNLMGEYIYVPIMENMYKKYLPEAPSIQEIEKNISMLFMNSHFSLTFPRPLLPTVIEVGGMHCRPGEPLPKNLEDFASGAKDGFILFSLGSIVKAKSMPEETRKAIVNVFSRLKQRVIWKWDGDDMPDLSKNVMLQKWVPQQDLLAHKNIRAFITHGGLLSTQEATYHGVPLIGLPLFADQDLNMAQAEKSGYCLTVEILGLTEETLEKALLKVLEDPRIYRDQPETPLERAIFWTEYIIRHKGAPHMQSPSKEMNFIQYHSFDVVAFLLLVFGTLIWMLKLLLWNICLKHLIFKIFNAKKRVGKEKKIN